MVHAVVSFFFHLRLCVYHNVSLSQSQEGMSIDPSSSSQESESEEQQQPQRQTLALEEGEEEVNAVACHLQSEDRLGNGSMSTALHLNCRSSRWPSGIPLNIRREFGGWFAIINHRITTQASCTRCSSVLLFLCVQTMPLSR